MLMTTPARRPPRKTLPQLILPMHPSFSKERLGTPNVLGSGLFREVYCKPAL
jgi:hypothetical protein